MGDVPGRKPAEEIGIGSLSVGKSVAGHNLET